ncbi:beta-ketoacyl synthase N-terminal-like domain-containing protein [Sphingorhabdus sp. EL138]|uniref:beta-ketoacyl synthase N-terminal-like domain-containing protein n=1 Tax=Sphingorhabdus sp. EL138 TaxID=2073156 RepID=UPI000D686EB7|nr:beta-ketoacyl synthase N-terminal-like domain-containing protein [Sphingorhabdus sp. EL138]
MNEDVVVTGYSYHTVYASEGSGIENTDPHSIDYSAQIPKRSDLRSQGLSQRLACFAAGQALEMAGIKAKNEILADADVMVSTHFGERDEQIDSRIFEAYHGDSVDYKTLISELSNLRPSLFLAQLQNLFAANISMVFGVTGMSVTFLGEIQAGVSAVEEARNRIVSGRSSVALVGGIFNGARPDMQSYFNPPSGTDFESTCGDSSLDLGFGCGFLVLERASFAKERKAKEKAILGEVVHKNSEENLVALKRMGGIDYVLTDVASSNKKIFDLTNGVLNENGPKYFGNLAQSTGSLMEASFPFSLCIASDVISGRLKFPITQSIDSPAGGKIPQQICVTAVGSEPTIASCVIERGQQNV